RISKEIQLLQEIIDEKNIALDDTSLDVLVEQVEAANLRKTQTDQAIIRLKFALEDIEGQFEDLESRLETARIKNEDLIRRQAKLEADVEQAGSKLRNLLLSLTENYKI
ncbi:hypothetical protein ACXWOC_09650, partial [Streptococcus pyogenes]